MSAKTKGRISRFTGERGDFLDAMAAEFISSTDRGSFYSLAATRYIRKFGYAIYGDAPELSTLSGADKEAELTRRRKFLPWLRTTLGSWFRHKYGSNRTDHSTLNKILLAMKDVGQQRPTRPRILHRYSQVHYKDRVKPNFDQFWESQEGLVPASQRLSMTQDYIQKSWASETPEFRAAFDEQVENEYQEALQVYNSRMEYTQTSPQVKLDAWHTIDSVVPNLADALGDWVGGSVHIDIVAPLGTDEGKIHVKSVQSRVMPAWTSDEEEAEGEVSDGATRLLFAEWDADADANHKANLVKYGNAIFSEEERANRIIPLETHVTAELTGTENQDDSTKLNGSEAPPPRRQTRKSQASSTPIARIIRPAARSFSPSGLSSGDDFEKPSGSSAWATLPLPHRTYDLNDVRADENGLFLFKDDEAIMAFARAAVHAAENGLPIPQKPERSFIPENRQSQPLARAESALHPSSSTPTATAQLLLGMLQPGPSQNRPSMESASMAAKVLPNSEEDHRSPTVRATYAAESSDALPQTVPTLGLLDNNSSPSRSISAAPSASQSHSVDFLSSDPPDFPPRSPPLSPLSSVSSDFELSPIRVPHREPKPPLRTSPRKRVVANVSEASLQSEPSPSPPNKRKLAQVDVQEELGNSKTKKDAQPKRQKRGVVEQQPTSAAVGGVRSRTKSNKVQQIEAGVAEGTKRSTRTAGRTAAKKRN